VGYEPKQKLVAALLGIFLGWLGVHRFYLGYNTIGAVQLALGLIGFFTCGVTTFAAWVWGIVDGVMILTGSIRTDATGVPLRD
jgi:TM2 domain-containing membrane protein YozV